MNFLQINKFSELHNDKNIIFCKTDFLLDEFQKIQNINNDVILITGNSDYAINDEYVNKAPKNIKRWFAQNALSNSEILIPLPLGLENKIPSNRLGHGIGYFERVLEKETLLSRTNATNPTKFLYSNFNVSTNYQERIKYKKISIDADHIDWEENNLSLRDYFNKILEYKMVLCPVGNGIDTHRLWETLYSKRIPVITKVGNYKIYELYEKLPIIILDDINKLYDKNFIEKEYEQIINNSYDLSFLTFDYWKNKIKEFK